MIMEKKCMCIFVSFVCILLALVAELYSFSYFRIFNFNIIQNSLLSNYTWKHHYFNANLTGRNNFRDVVIESFRRSSRNNGIQMYGSIHLRMQTSKSVNNSKHSINILKKHRDNLTHGNVVNVTKSDPLNGNGDFSSEKNGIQMSADQIKVIWEVLPSNGNLLVWGLGNDSPYWHSSTDGKVIFIEDDSPSRKAGIQWYDEMMQKFPFLEVYRVHYKTHMIKSFSKYVNNPYAWHELDLCDQLPEAVTRTHWHVIIVDAPLGCCGTGPGRYQSIFTSWKLAKNGTHIFVDDFDRQIEQRLSMNIFGRPEEVIKRQNTEFSKANKQAHYIINPENVFTPYTRKWNRAGQYKRISS